MSTSLRFTSADLELFPDDGKRREIIDGELYVSKQPNWYHQAACSELVTMLNIWNHRTGAGQVIFAPGVIFAEDDDVAPDLVWVSTRRLTEILRADGHLHGPPELVVEVLSPGAANEQRDREVKLKLYSRRGVDEYWIVDWRTRTVAIFRSDGEQLRHVATLTEDDDLQSPLLPGFFHQVADIFVDIPKPS